MKRDAVIAVKLYAGLGNQMFQYAFARYLSIRHGSRLWFDLSWYEGNSGPRTFRLNQFNTVCDGFFDPHAMAGEFTPINEWDFDERIEGWNEIVELGSGIVLDGYWANHTEYLFEPGFSRTIRREFCLAREPDSDAYAHYRALLGRTPGHNVSLHVRRGDYQLNQQVFTRLDQCYYDGAISTLEGLVKPAAYFVFSDDIGQAREEISFPEGTVFVETGNDLLDLDLMKRCDHHVVANSTFSWWGAYLNGSDAKRVVAPARWFTDEDYQRQYESYRSVPDSWMRIG